MSRYYRTNSRIAGVDACCGLPENVRVEHVAHENFNAVTLTYDDDRRDHLLVKAESVPGIREVRIEQHLIKYFSYFC
jgi:hypothetical protein